jgi:hypothetical protein
MTGKQCQLLRSINNFWGNKNLIFMLSHSVGESLGRDGRQANQDIISGWD